MQLRKSLEEAAAAEAEAEEIDSEQARVKLLATLGPLMEERRRELEVELAQARSEVTEAITAAHRQAKAQLLREVQERTGVTLDEGQGVQRYPWSDVPWVGTGRVHVFLQTAARKAIIVPLRAFEDEAAMTRFAEFADAASSAADA